MVAERAGTYEPICASTAMSAFWRRNVDLPAMLGPVTSQMRPSAVSSPGRALPPPPSTQSLSMKAPALAAFSACSTTGWRPPRISKAWLSSTRGPRVALGARQLGERRPWRRARPARRRCARGRAARASIAAASSAKISCSRLRARSVAEAMRPSMSTSSAVEKRTALAIVWRWRNSSDERRLQQRLGVALRHLDEEAEDVVVAHLQRFDAGALDVVRLEPGHHAAAVLLQAARLVELRPVALAHEAAVALQMRRIVDERRRQRICERRIDRAQLAGDAAQLLGQTHARRLRRPADRAQRSAAASPSRTAARSRGEPRPKPSRDTARAISGAALQRSAQIAAQRLLIDEKADGVEPAVDARHVAQRACQPRRQLARAGAGDGAIDRGEQAALLLARRRSAPAPGWRGSRHR